MRRQVAALPYRLKPKLEVLLLTSRDTRRPVIPKGWPMKGRKKWESAAIEALEEAGIVGKIMKRSIGRYLYWKRQPDHFVLCSVEVFPLRVTRQVATWREMHQRHMRWLTPEQAAILVDEPGLSTLIRDFSPPHH